jgi:hypothetical protein
MCPEEIVTRRKRSLRRRTCRYKRRNALAILATSKPLKTQTKTIHVRTFPWFLLLLPTILASTLVLAEPLPPRFRNLPIHYVDGDSAPPFTPEQKEKLVAFAGAFARTITQGSRKDLTTLLAQVYRQGINNPDARDFVYGQRTPTTTVGYRTNLSQYAAFGLLAVNVTGIESGWVSARVYFYDRTRISVGGVMEDAHHCTARGTSYVAQTFVWHGNHWALCCERFEAESDRTCSRGPADDEDTSSPQTESAGTP